MAESQTTNKVNQITLTDKQKYRELPWPVWSCSCYWWWQLHRCSNATAGTCAKRTICRGSCSFRCRRRRRTDEDRSGRRCRGRDRSPNLAPTPACEASLPLIVDTSEESNCGQTAIPRRLSIRAFTGAYSSDANDQADAFDDGNLHRAYSYSCSGYSKRLLLRSLSFSPHRLSILEYISTAPVKITMRHSHSGSMLHLPTFFYCVPNRYRRRGNFIAIAAAATSVFNVATATATTVLISVS